MYEESRKLANELGLKPYYMYRQKNMVGNMENLGYSRKGAECIYNIEMKNKGTPIGNRNKEEFKEYYDKIWKDIDFHV